MRPLALVVFLVLGASVHAEAQRDPVLIDGAAVRLSSADQIAYDSIAAESDAATGLYITAAIAAGLGMGSLAAALGAAFSGVVTAFDGPSSSGYFNWSEAFLYIAAGLGGLAVVSLPLAIGLNVDAGSRRRGLTERYRVQLSSTGLAFSGEF